MVAKINRGSSLFGTLAAHPATAALDPEDGAKIETLTARLNTAEAERLKSAAETVKSGGAKGGK